MRESRANDSVLRIGIAALGALVWLVSALPAAAQSDYPLIKSLGNDDVVYQQLEQDISTYYRAVSNGRPAPALGMYVYYTRKDDDLYGVAAAVNLPYETIATANGLDHPLTFAPNTRLLLPSIPGIFVPLEPESELEYLMAAWRAKDLLRGSVVNLRGAGGTRAFYFVSGQRFHAVERAFFLNILFRFPLPKAVVTSRFGMRVDPFTREESFHSGIDLAAPWGTDVYAAREGKVEYAGEDSTYGNFIILAHAGGYETVYGHLSKILVQLNEQVTSGMIIGRVGSTGMSTGPHLHFEIRRYGRPEDPAPLLPMGGQ